ncbi:MAG TPA: DUF3144 domain-containing protein [Cyclobacteriaceae bacterium]|nr:DUF3144 domain-containing protein [Cyclobacteriaceae bacterium]
MEKNKRISKEAMADKFIELANTFATTEDKEQVSVAIMFAAARYNAFDAYSKSGNLAQDKNSASEWYCKEYERMLDANLDDFISTEAP